MPATVLLRLPASSKAAIPPRPVPNGCRLLCRSQCSCRLACCCYAQQQA